MSGDRACARASPSAPGAATACGGARRRRRCGRRAAPRALLERRRPARCGPRCRPRARPRTGAITSSWETSRDRRRAGAGRRRAARRRAVSETSSRHTRASSTPTATPPTQQQGRHRDAPHPRGGRLGQLEVAHRPPSAPEPHGAERAPPRSAATAGAGPPRPTTGIRSAPRSVAAARRRGGRRGRGADETEARRTALDPGPGQAGRDVVGQGAHLGVDAGPLRSGRLRHRGARAAGQLLAGRRRGRGAGA